MAVTVEFARSLYQAGGGGHDFDHVLRVLAIAERIADREGADEEIVRSAALLHDIAENEDRDLHHLIGAERARQILEGREEEAFAAAVAHCIEAHRFRHEPQPETLEAKVLSDADKLDAIGAIGIGRAFAYAGAHGTKLWNGTLAQIWDESGDAQRSPKSLGHAYTPAHEFVYKLSRIPERLYTPSARQIAAGRIAFMHSFFERLDAEATGTA